MTTRLRTNFAQGTVSDNPLAIGATTMNAAGFDNLPTVAAPDFLVVEIDPLRAVGTPEIVYVTAHTAGQTSATVLRGQEGTTARAHNFGERWVHGASAGDFWGGGQQWYGRQQIDGYLDVLNDLNVIPASNALQLAGTVTGFVAGGNGVATYVQSGGAALYDPHEGAIRLTAGASGNPTLTYNMPSTTTAFPVTVGNRYWAMARSRPVGAGAARNVTVGIQWWSAAGADLGVTTGTAATEVTGGAWVIASVSGVAPATAAYATIVYTVTSPTANTEAHDVTAFAFGSGTAAPAAYVTPYMVRLQDTAKRDSEYTNTNLFAIDTQGYGDLETPLTRYSDVSWSKAFWMIRRARGTKAAPTNVSAGDYVGGLRALAWRDGTWRGLGDSFYTVDTVGTGQAAGRLSLMANDLAGTSSIGFDIYGSSGLIFVRSGANAGSLVFPGQATVGFNRNTATGAIQNASYPAWQITSVADYFQIESYTSAGASNGNPLKLLSTPKTVNIDATWGLWFGQQTRQMLNLWDLYYGIGVQSATMYFRTGSQFAWFRAGLHSDTGLDPGSGGTMVGYWDSANNFYIRDTTGATTRIGLESGNARVYVRGDQSGMVCYDLANNTRFLFGLRSDITGNTSDMVWYSYGGAISLMVGGTTVFKAGTDGFPVLHAPPWQYPTLNNSWTNYGTGGGWEQARYCKDSEGFVHIEGLLTGGVMTSGTQIFQLPVGYRPVLNHMFVVQAGAGLYRLDVWATGQVVLNNAMVAGSNAFLQLDGIKFSVN